MSHFYGTTQGHRGITTRTGTKSSGLISTANGWNIGGEVQVNYSTKLQTDVVSLYVTAGSCGNTTKCVASFAIIDGKRQLLNTNYPELFI